MEDRKLDIMLSDVLKPSFSPDDSLNKKLKEMLRSKDNNGTGGGMNSNLSHKESKIRTLRKKKTYRNPVSSLIKVAIVMLAIASIGTVGVYAANYFLKQTEVYDHGISVGNQEYVKDEDFTEPWEPVPEEVEGTFEGGPDDKWIRKEVLVTNGAYRNTYYDYPDYETAVEDSRLENIFSESIGEPETICYVVTEEIPGVDPNKILYKEYELDSTFRCDGKYVFVCQSVAEGVSSDGAYSVILNKTSNERTYTSPSGIVFTLVDDVEAKINGGTEIGTRTYVMISYDRVRGYICFEEMSDDEIHSILDKVVIDLTETTEKTETTEE